MKLLASILTIIALSSILPGCPEATQNAQSGPTQTQEKQLKYYDWVYELQVKSVLFYRGDKSMNYPFLYLGDPTPLTISFDELLPRTAQASDFWITMVNCDEYWQPTTLLPIEFLEGFTTDRITNFIRSENTRIPYIHYEYSFPSQSIQFKRGGNFLLKIFRAGDEEDLIITRRFTVADNKVGINPLIGKSLYVTQRNRLQRVDFTLNIMNLPIRDPRQDLEVVMLQNGRWDNAVFDLEPTFIQDKELEFQIDAQRQFDGGDEFRILDMRTFRFYTAAINNIENRDSIYYVNLYVDETRAEKSYFSNRDLNGRYFVEVQEWSQGSYMADYGLVNFKLKSPDPITDGDVYVIGDLDGYACSDAFKMEYNPAKFRYEAEILLKQGYYNYKYAVLPHNSTLLDESRFEGSHFETENDYTILVYFRNPLLRSPELVGFSHFNYYNR